MDKLIFVPKNYSSNPRVHYLKPTDFAISYEVESKLMAKLEAKFENEIEGFPDLSKFIKFLVCGGVRRYIENDDKKI
jgi:hypothetical protein